MVSNNNEIELSDDNEEKLEEKIEEKEVNRMSKNKDCLRIAGLDFEICIGKVYSFSIGRRIIIGIIDEINPRYLRIKVTTERGTVVLDLKKVSIIEEIR